MDNNYKIRLVKSNRQTTECLVESDDNVAELGDLGHKNANIISPNSPIIKKLREAEERQKKENEKIDRRKMSDDELIELEFRALAQKMREDEDLIDSSDVSISSDFKERDDIDEVEDSSEATPFQRPYTSDFDASDIKIISEFGGEICDKNNIGNETIEDSSFYSTDSSIKSVESLEFSDNKNINESPNITESSFIKSNYIESSADEIDTFGDKLPDGKYEIDFSNEVFDDNPQKSQESSIDMQSLPHNPFIERIISENADDYFAKHFAEQDEEFYRNSADMSDDVADSDYGMSKDIEGAEDFEHSYDDMYDDMKETRNAYFENSGERFGQQVAFSEKVNEGGSLEGITDLLEKLKTPSAKAKLDELDSINFMSESKNQQDNQAIKPNKSVESSRVDFGNVESSRVESSTKIDNFSENSQDVSYNVAESGISEDFGKININITENPIGEADSRTFSSFDAMQDSMQKLGVNVNFLNNDEEISTRNLLEAVNSNDLGIQLRKNPHIPIMQDSSLDDEAIVVIDMNSPGENLLSEEVSDGEYMLPPTSLLNPPSLEKFDIDDNEIDQKVHSLYNKLKVFKIEGDIVETYSGPVVTTFEFRPAMNVKVSRIQNLQDDLSMALKATSIRIQAPIPGKDVVGIEIPNNKIETIYLREIFESDEFRNSSASLAIALGKDVTGNPIVEDLATLPHLLIAGTTGSGKSVGLNAMILSLLYKNTPKDLRLIMIDPKKLEFGIYADIPHLLTPIITDCEKPQKVILALSKSVEEMNRRYEMMNEARVRTIAGYNEYAENNGLEKLPYIVIIIDEFAELILNSSGREIEQYLASLAGKARASGIHLIIATQRPTVNVVTGLIKGNLPARISYRVNSKIDSKVILDETGAESLLGKGDMLFLKYGISRMHAPYNDEKEIERVVNFIKAQQQVEYDEFFSLEPKETPAQITPVQISGEADYLQRVKEIILQSNKTSISYLQRRLGVGFNKAATLVEQLEKEGFLSPPNSKGMREIIGE